jgi:hypothetical protein
VFWICPHCDRGQRYCCAYCHVPDVAVFENFRKHFIQAGLIGERFAPVIAAAQQRNVEELVQLEDEVFSLLESVETLYRGMDNSLRFAAEAKVARST